MKLANRGEVGISILFVENTANQKFKWTKEWKIKLKGGRSIHEIFENKRITNHSIFFVDVCIPYANAVKYIGITLAAKLLWKEQIEMDRIELYLKLRQ